MLDALNQWDMWLFTCLNSLNSPLGDVYFWLVSNRFTWVVLYALLAYLLLRTDWRQGLLIIAMLGLAVLIADQVSSSLIKPIVERPRPSHETALAAVHIVNGHVGGPYGFVSSHAANMMSVGLLLSMVMRYRWFTVAAMLWVALICYSRIYLGMHYPGDIAGGLIVGAATAAILWWAYRSMAPRLGIASLRKPHPGARVATIAFVAYNILLIIAAAVAFAFHFVQFAE